MRDKYGNPLIEHQCSECGQKRLLRRNSAAKMKTSFCQQCARRNNKGAKGNNKTHGMTGSKLYQVWSSMKQRCQNPKHPDFANYGGRGISVNVNWEQDFMSFYSWAVSSGYEEGLSIDRIDNNKNYEPRNCRWVGRSTQNSNQRTRKRASSKYRGVKKVGNKFSATYWDRRVKKNIYLGTYATEEEAAEVYRAVMPVEEVA